MFAIIPPLFVLFVFTFYHFHPKYLLFRPRSDFEKKKRANQTGTTSQSQPPQHRQKTPLQEQIDADKSLYHALQNAQDFPEALPVGRKRLLELLDHTINLTLLTPDKSSTILSISSFSSESLKDFLQSAEDATSAKFDAYLHRRKHGGGREMFPDREYAEYWVRQSAPVKYVDGAWLGGVHRVDTLPKDRRWSKTAWQILSEELGDGDLEKNHIAVYEKLLNSICDIGRGDERRFIDPAVNPNNDARVWTAAVAQLFVSLYADEFLPEILGFNMAYESLPYHLLLTIHELRELDLDPYYFLLHIVIDNSDCGHAAMGREAVVGLINAAETEEEQAELWRRVQAGFILAESLPTTPTPLSRATKRIIELFGRKAVTARPMHASCPAKIGGKGGKTLAQWLDPEVYNKHYMDFLQALTDSRWIVRGDPKNSKLIQELRWGGRMFGAFTAEEVDVLWMWIKELNDITYLITPSKAVGAYQKFAGRKTLDRTFPPPLHAPSLPDPPLKAPWLILDLPPIETQLCKNHLLSLLILTAAPFEHLPAHIVKAATPHGMAAIKTLRALYGLLPETEVVAGMDEVMRGGPVGVVEIAQRLGGRLDEEDLLVRTILTLSRAPKRRWWELVGIQTGLVIDVLMNTGLWEQLGVEELMAEIGERCIQVLRLLLDESVCDQEAVRRGFWIVREGLKNAGGRREERERMKVVEVEFVS